MNIAIANDIAVIQCTDEIYDLGALSGALRSLDELGRPVVFDVRSMQHALSEIEWLLLTLQLEELQNLRQHGLTLVARVDDDEQLAYFVARSKDRHCPIDVFDNIDEAIATASQRC